MASERVKAHFEEEAHEFDMIIQKLIPHYNEMINATVCAIPFQRESAFSVIDLGCGTGALSKAVQQHFPNAEITCVDIADKMLEIARGNLKGAANFIQADFHKFDFSDTFDVIVSSLALHHLESDNDKLKFYRKIYSALNCGGVFINTDVVLGSDEMLQQMYMKKWLEFMSENVSEDEIANKWLPNYYAEDRPAKLTSHLDMLKSCGFSLVDVVYKYYNFTVYCAKK